MLGTLVLLPDLPLPRLVLPYGRIVARLSSRPQSVFNVRPSVQAKRKAHALPARVRALSRFEACDLALFVEVLLHNSLWEDAVFLVVSPGMRSSPLVAS